MTAISRRTVLAGAAATTAVASVNAILAPSVSADSATAMQLFLKLSSVLTGISESKLAPTKDPINIKETYFDRARRDPHFGRLLQMFDPGKPETAEFIFKHPEPEIRYLARSIMLAWYLGAWYEPQKLASPSSGPISFEVISAQAYTQGWVWRVAQAHPMGYSELPFGYWSNNPFDLDTFIK
jgi:hypothetical protein